MVHARASFGQAAAEVCGSMQPEVDGLLWHVRLTLGCCNTSGSVESVKHAVV
jgi:hypothetical protein